jgi:DNA polymerase III subunit delta'
MDYCGTCPACSKNLKYVHPDTHFVFPMGNLKADQDEDRFKAETLKTWRSFLREQPFGNLRNWVNYYGGEDKQINISKEESRSIIKALSLKPFESPYKVMIIWQPEYMHPSAANGILKILEEPPPQTFFLLVTNSAETLLPTILSRTQLVNVPLLPDETVESFLLKTQDLNEDRRKKIAQLAEGNLNQALVLVETEEDDNQENFTAWMRACFKKDYAGLISLSEEFHELDKLSQHNFLQYGLTMLRETLLHRSGAIAISRVRGGELKFITDFSKVMTVDRIEKSSTLVSEAEYHIERNGSAKMIFMDLSIRIARIIN